MKSIAGLLSFTLFLAVQAIPARDRTPRLAEVITRCTEKNTAALTFDDGPYIYTKEISDILTKARAKGTFFVNGNNYGCIYAPESIASLKYAHRQGHQIASHTWAHEDLATLPIANITEEFSRLDNAIYRIIGSTPAFMRPPYGSYNKDVQRVAAERDQKVVIWDFDSGDTVGATAEESKALYNSTVSARPRSILTLNHETVESTVREVLPYAIEILKKKGYKLVTVAECLGENAYNRGAPKGYNSRDKPTC